MKQMTAVEWLAKQMMHPQNHNPYIEQAKEIEKQQIIKSRENGISEGYRRTNNFYYDKMVDSDTYFEKTYGSKGNDDHIVDTNEMIDHIGDANEMVEISDEEIGKGCDENIPLDEADMWSERLYFRIGAKWYREQLKGGNNES